MHSKQRSLFFLSSTHNKHNNQRQEQMEHQDAATEVEHDETDGKPKKNAVDSSEKKMKRKRKRSKDEQPEAEAPSADTNKKKKKTTKSTKTQDKDELKAKGRATWTLIQRRRNLRAILSRFRPCFSH